MSRLTIFPEKQADHVQLETDLALEISALLEDQGITFKQAAWHGAVDSLLADEEQQSDIKRDIVPLERQHQFPFHSLVIVDSLYPNFERLRLKYLSEYSVDKDELLYVLEGRLLLSFHINEQVLQLLCKAGDVVIIPAGVSHWLDIGQGNERLCVLFCRQQNQAPIMHYSGNNIADLFPRLA